MKQDCERHLAGCAYCSSQVALFRSFESAHPSPDERDAVASIVSQLRKNSPAAPEPWWAKIWRPRILAPAAIGLAAPSVIIIANLHPKRDGLEIPVQSVTRSTQVVAIAPLGELAEPPSRLRWEPIAGANKYNVRILEVDRTELWHATTESPSIEIPQEVRAKIVPLKKLLWEATALDAIGNPVATSGIQSFVVAR